MPVNPGNMATYLQRHGKRDEEGDAIRGSREQCAHNG